MGILKGVKDRVTVDMKTTITDPEDSTKGIPISGKGTFRRRDYEAAHRAIQSVRNPDTETSEADLIREDLLDWNLPGDGGPVEFSAENVDAALAHPEYRSMLFDAWGQAQLGRVLANAKNS